MKSEFQDASEIRRKDQLDVIRKLSDDTAKETYYQLNIMVKAITRKQNVWNLEEKIIEIEHDHESNNSHNAFQTQS